MPKVSVIREDNMVYVDGTPISVDCSDLPVYFHAIQWDGQKGHIEFAPDASGRRMPNLHLTTLDPYMYLIDRWNRQRAIEEEKRAAIERANKEAKEKDEAIMKGQAAAIERKRNKRRK